MTRRDEIRERAMNSFCGKANEGEMCRCHTCERAYLLSQLDKARELLKRWYAHNSSDIHTIECAWVQHWHANPVRPCDCGAKTLYGDTDAFLEDE